MNNLSNRSIQSSSDKNYSQGIHLSLGMHDLPNFSLKKKSSSIIVRLHQALSILFKNQATSPLNSFFFYSFFVNIKIEIDFGQGWSLEITINWIYVTKMNCLQTQSWQQGQKQAEKNQFFLSIDWMDKFECINHSEHLIGWSPNSIPS